MRSRSLSVIGVLDLLLWSLSSFLARLCCFLLTFCLSGFLWRFCVIRLLAFTTFFRLISTIITWSFAYFVTRSYFGACWVPFSTYVSIFNSLFLPFCVLLDWTLLTLQLGFPAWFGSLRFFSLARSRLPCIELPLVVRLLWRRREWQWRGGVGAFGPTIDLFDFFGKATIGCFFERFVVDKEVVDKIYLCEGYRELSGNNFGSWCFTFSITDDECSLSRDLVEFRIDYCDSMFNDSVFGSSIFFLESR